VGDFYKASPTSEPKEVADRTLWEKATDADVTLEKAAAAVASMRN
jgi:hypothetical protein